MNMSIVEVNKNVKRLMSQLSRADISPEQVALVNEGLKKLNKMLSGIKEDKIYGKGLVEEAREVIQRSSSVAKILEGMSVKSVLNEETKERIVTIDSLDFDGPFVFTSSVPDSEIEEMMANAVKEGASTEWEVIDVFMKDERFVDVDGYSSHYIDENLWD